MGYRVTLGPLEVMDMTGHALAEPICRCGYIDRVTKCRRNSSWMAACAVLAGLSVYPAANSDSSRRDNNSTGNRADDGPCDEGGPAGADAACAIDAASANDRACFHRAQGDEASCQQ
jgi:hypothetical protein